MVPFPGFVPADTQKTPHPSIKASLPGLQQVHTSEYFPADQECFPV